MTFYLLAPWLLRSDRLALAALVGSMAVRVVVFFVVGPHAPAFATYIIWSYFFLPSTFMFFMLGHLARRVPYIGTAGPWPAFAILIAAVWFVSRDHWAPAGDWFPINDYAAAVLFALALPGVFEATKNNRLSNWLGDLTYPLYLTHDTDDVGALWPMGARWRAGHGIRQFCQVLQLAIHHGLGAICAGGDHLFAGRADRPRAGRIAAAVRRRAGASPDWRRWSGDRRPRRCRGSTGVAGSVGENQLAAPAMGDAPKGSCRSLRSLPAPPRKRDDPESTPQNRCGTRRLAAGHRWLKLVAFERISSRPTEEGWWHRRRELTW